MMWTSVIKSVVWICAMGAALFVPAGTLYGRGGWIFMGEMALFSVASVIWLAKCDPGLLKERLGNPIQKGQTFPDKILVLTMLVSWYGWLVLMTLDIKRWHVSAEPEWVTYTGAVLTRVVSGGIR